MIHSMLRLREILVEAEENRILGEKSYTIEEVSDMMKKGTPDENV